MVNFNDFYTIFLLLSAAIIFVMGMCLLGFSVPRNPELKNYRISRRFLACAYIILASTSSCEICIKEDFGDAALNMAFTLIAASFQAFLFTFSMITLIDRQFLTRKRVLNQLLPIIVLSGILLVCLFFKPEGILFRIILFFCIACYCIQLVYNIYLFNSEYRKYRKKMDNYFSGDEEQRLRWIWWAFYMALGIGIFAFLSVFFKPFLFTLFTIGYISFYVFYAVKYINYVSIFFHYAPAMDLPVPEEAIPVPESCQLAPVIEKWVSEKKFVIYGINLNALSREFGTNQTYLSHHINANMGMNFKLWISALRIEESKGLLTEHPDKAVAYIGEMVGITNKSSFFRQFMNVTGMTPGEYREKYKKMP